MLENLIVSFIEKRKKICGAIFGFIIAILLLEYGIWKTIFIALMTYAGYKLNESDVIDKLKKKLIERLQD